MTPARLRKQLPDGIRVAIGGKNCTWIKDQWVILTWLNGSQPVNYIDGKMAELGYDFENTWEKEGSITRLYAPAGDV